MQPHTVKQPLDNVGRFNIRRVSERTFFSLVLPFCVCLLGSWCFGGVVSAEGPLIGAGDRVALIGGTLIESLQSRGDCEALVILRQPALRVPFRNLGWSGDDIDGIARRVFGAQPDGYARLIQDVAKAEPTVVVLGYGFAESSNGIGDVERFEAGLRRQIVDFSERSIRVILMQPFELPGVKASGYDEAVRRCRDVVATVAEERKLPVIDPWPAIAPIGIEAFDAAGLRLSRAGQRAVGAALAAGLLGEPVGTVMAAANDPKYGVLSDKIAEKNALFFHRYRPMNETYLFLFRKHEQGNNAVEVDQFEPLVEKMESAIWAQVKR